MQEEIGLREYIDVIVRRWKLVLGIPLVAVVTAAIVSFLITPTYETTATLSVPQPSPSIAYTSLIESTEVESQAIDLLNASLSPAERVPGGLIDKVRVSRESDGRLIRITVQSDTSKKAAQIANAWAEASIRKLSAPEFLEAQEREILDDPQLKVAKQSLNEAQQALDDFLKLHGLGTSGYDAIEQELRDLEQTLATYPSYRDWIEVLIETVPQVQDALRSGESAYGFASAIQDSLALAINIRVLPFATAEVSVGRTWEVLYPVRLRLVDVIQELEANAQILRQYEANKQDIEVLIETVPQVQDALRSGESAYGFASAIQESLAEVSVGRTWEGLGPVHLRLANVIRELEANEQILRQYEANKQDIKDSMREVVVIREAVAGGESIPEIVVVPLIMARRIPEGVNIQVSSLLASSLITSDQVEILDGWITALSAEEQATLAAIQEHTRKHLEILDRTLAALKAEEQATLAAIQEHTGKHFEILDRTLAALKAAETDVSDVIKRISDDISQRESWLESKEELDYLKRARDSAEQVYASAAQRAQDEGIALRVVASTIELSEPARVPEQPIRPNVLQNLLIAGTLGLLVGVVGALALEYLEVGKHRLAI